MSAPRRALAALAALAWLAAAPGAAAGPADRASGRPVNGWILLDDDASSVARALAAAPAFGVNQVQFSHALVDSVDWLIGPGSEARVALLRDAARRAHAEGIETWIWSREFPRSVGFEVCFSPGSPDLAARAEAYRRALEALPEVDGVVLMFGSAGRPPWRVRCSCPWCLWHHPIGWPFCAPPMAERLERVVRTVAGVVQGELHRKLVVRTFVHEAPELAWHADALAAARDLDFLGMHKAEVQDFQPYHPGDPTMGDAEAHDSLLELDAAGEFQGRTALPFAAPDYFAFRLREASRLRAVGAATRIENGGLSALGTPNEVNLLAVRDQLDDPEQPVQATWDEFLERTYGLAPGSRAQRVLRAILQDTFPIRLRSHYVLGIWVFGKDSELPKSARPLQLFDRGRAYRWDPAWRETWQRLVRPDKQTVAWVWQESNEALTLAERSLSRFSEVAPTLAPEKRADLERRLIHQRDAAEAWRAMRLFVFAERARSTERRRHSLGRVASLAARRNPDFPAWSRWAYEELARIAARMRAHGLAAAPVASPERVESFRHAVARFVTDVPPRMPALPGLSPLDAVEVGASEARLRFTPGFDAHVTLEWGQRPPTPDAALDLGMRPAGVEVETKLSGLAPGARYVARLRARSGDVEVRGAWCWIFTPPR